MARAASAEAVVAQVNAGNEAFSRQADDLIVLIERVAVAAVSPPDRAVNTGVPAVASFG